MSTPQLLYLSPTAVTSPHTSGRTIVTPQHAQAWLAHSHRNRTVNKRKLAEYTASMVAGTWYYNGEPLIFDTAGKLMDGQHRLLACIAASQPFETYIVIGVNVDTMPVIDTGAMRSPGDALSIMREVDSSKMVASALNWLWLYQTGNLGVTAKMQMPRTLALEYFDTHRGVTGSLSYGYKAKKFLPPGPATALHYLMTQKDQDLADTFFSTLVLGENLHTGEGMYILRKRLQNDWGSKLRMNPIYKCALTVKIWNDWRAGKLQRIGLRWRAGVREQTERFPQVD